MDEKHILLKSQSKTNNNDDQINRSKQNNQHRINLATYLPV
jgi:hypothetical protein